MLEFGDLGLGDLDLSGLEGHGAYRVSSIAGDVIQRSGVLGRTARQALEGPTFYETIPAGDYARLLSHWHASSSNPGLRY